MNISIMDSNMAIIKELGRREKALRIQKDLSQESLADKSGVSVSTISRFERGLGDGVSIGQVLNIMRALHLTDRANFLFPEDTFDPAFAFDTGRPERKRVGKRRKSTKSIVWGEDR